VQVLLASTPAGIVLHRNEAFYMCMYIRIACCRSFHRHLIYSRYSCIAFTCSARWPASKHDHRRDNMVGFKCQGMHTCSSMGLCWTLKVTRGLCRAQRKRSSPVEPILGSAQAAALLHNCFTRVLHVSCKLKPCSCAIPPQLLAGNEDREH
jgi:hypothetical protein